MVYRISGETVVRWEALIGEESGETNAEDATAKACEEAQDSLSIAGIQAAPGVALSFDHHHTAASGCERVDSDSQADGHNHVCGEGTPGHEDSAGRGALGRSPGGFGAPASEGVGPGKPGGVSRGEAE